MQPSRLVARRRFSHAGDDDDDTNMLAIEEHSIDFIPLDERRTASGHVHALLWWRRRGSQYWCRRPVRIPGRQFHLDRGRDGDRSIGRLCARGFHAAQGPTLGIPQMIQSRAQFGFRGSIFAMIMAEFIYIGFFASNPSASALLVVGGAPTLSVIFLTVVIAVLCALVALFGYNLSHALGKILTVVAIVVYLAAFLTLIFHNTLPNGGVGSSRWILLFGALPRDHILQFHFCRRIRALCCRLFKVPQARRECWSRLGMDVSRHLGGRIVASCIRSPARCRFPTTPRTSSVRSSRW